MYATQLAGVPSYRRDLGEPWAVARVFWCTMSKSRMLAGIQALRDAGDTETFEGFDADGPLADEDADRRLDQIAAAADGLSQPHARGRRRAPCRGGLDCCCCSGLAAECFRP